MDNNTIAFAISETGASHIPKGIPCQDYSLKWESEDGNNKIIIVCDGHGSSTYVRSDIGARLAAEITRDLLIDFISDTDPLLFIYQKGSVTARPSLDETTWGVQPNKPFSLMTEVEQMNHKQNLLFYKQVQEIRVQDSAIYSLFNQIYQNWLAAIKLDSKTIPFNEKELELIGRHPIVKAYGTTLMAFVRTPYYWLSFHIGDGRIVAADRGLNWVQPVPWDCNCFQNYTTSLCNTNPLKSFRYAFDGTGNFPIAVICCSDGIEDSYGDYDIAPQYLHKFYNGLLDSFIKEGESMTIENMTSFLPKLSSVGSKDDMSIAGIVNLDAIADGIEEFHLCSMRDTINAQHTERVRNLQASEAKIDKYKKELEEAMAKLETSMLKRVSILDGLRNLLQQEERLRSDKNMENRIISDLQEQINSQSAIIEKMLDDINEEREKSKREDEEALRQKTELKRRYDEIELRISAQEEADVTKWKEAVAHLLTNRENTETDEFRL